MKQVGGKSLKKNQLLFLNFINADNVRFVRIVFNHNFLLLSRKKISKLAGNGAIPARTYLKDCF